MQIISRSFSALNLNELYALLKLRQDVFVVEQQCAYPELDGFDHMAHHVMGIGEDGLLAYARILPPESVYTEPSIGRVCVAKPLRGYGYAREIFRFALENSEKLYPDQNIKIQAQSYLEEFYERFAFTTVSEPYLDVGIWHVDMIRKAKR